MTSDEPGERDPSRDGPPGSSDGVVELFSKLVRALASSMAGTQDALQRLLAAHTDRAQLAIRRRVQLGIWVLVAAMAGGTATVLATIVLVRGVTQGLTLLCGGREWLGSIASAGLFLGLVVWGTALGLRRWDRQQLAKQEAKYAKLRAKRRHVHARSGR